MAMATSQDNPIRWYFGFSKQVKRALSNQDDTKDGSGEAGVGQRQEEQEDVVGDGREENQHDRREEIKSVYEGGEAKPDAWWRGIKALMKATGGTEDGQGGVKWETERGAESDPTQEGREAEEKRNNQAGEAADR